MEENKPLATETEYPDSDTDIINGDGTPIIDTSDQNVDTAQEESNTSKSDSEESTENSSTTNTEENGAEKDTTTEVVTDPANDPATLESALLVSTYAALNKLAEYVPTEYVNNSEPDIDAEHLNNTEQGLLRVTNLLNGAVDVINDLQTTVAKQASAIDTLNSNLDLLITQKITVPISFNVPDYSKYRFLYFKIITDDSYSGDAFIVPRKLYNLFSKSVRIDATLSGPYYVQLSMLFATGTLRVERANFGTAWNNVTIQCYGIK